MSTRRSGLKAVVRTINVETSTGNDVWLSVFMCVCVSIVRLNALYNINVFEFWAGHSFAVNGHSFNARFFTVTGLASHDNMIINSKVVKTEHIDPNQTN